MILGEGGMSYLVQVGAFGAIAESEGQREAAQTDWLVSNSEVPLWDIVGIELVAGLGR